jgi:hypothetical protein
MTFANGKALVVHDSAYFRVNSITFGNGNELNVFANCNISTNNINFANGAVLTVNATTSIGSDGIYFQNGNSLRSPDNRSVYFANGMYVAADANLYITSNRLQFENGAVLTANARLNINYNNIQLNNNGYLYFDNNVSLTVNTNATIGPNYIAIGGNSSSNDTKFESFQDNENLGMIITSYLGYKLVVFNTVVGSSGNYTAYKQFTIDHPLEKDKYLMHACLEGPEAGVYYRGTSFFDPLEKYREIALPDYVDAFTTEFTVHLTPIIEEADDDDFPAIPTLAASRVKKGKFRVYGTTACHFDYLVMAKRGSINVEPLKSEVNVKRLGPYTWL